MKTLERGDIESIVFGGHDGLETQVRGYQNFNMFDNNIIPLNNPTAKRPWTDTKVKSMFFESVLGRINPKTYIDFGSNLGYYVFLAAHKGIKSVGVDYNLEYISVCNAMKTRHAIANASFIHTNLEQMSDHLQVKHDFMTVFNVIHHLYNRTEKYMDMSRLIGDFSSKATDILFEVPTEKDPKGHKWTMDTGYTEALFVETANQLFDSVERINGQTEHRPYYLCRGSL